RKTKSPIQEKPELRPRRIRFAKEFQIAGLAAGEPRTDPAAPGDVRAPGAAAASLPHPPSVEQPEKEPDRHDDHRPRQQDAADLTHVAQPELDDMPHHPNGLVEKPNRIEAERF